jgi:hypothetical protein
MARSQRDVSTIPDGEPFKGKVDHSASLSPGEEPGMNFTLAGR